MGFAKGEIGCNLNYSRVVARGPVERVACLKRQKEVRGGRVLIYGDGKSKQNEQQS